MTSHRRPVRTLFAAAFAASLAPAALADPIRLATGEVLEVTILETTDSTIRFRHPVLGELTIPRDQVTLLPLPPAPPAPDPAAAPPPPADPAPAAPAPAAEPPAPAPRLSFTQGWGGEVEGGLNGSEGNSETLSARFGIGAKRATERMESSLNLSYAYSKDDGNTSKSRGELAARNDWLFKDSPWGFFALGKVEYDQFQDWDWRFSGFLGPSYTFIKDDRGLIRGRAGLGGSYELGGTNEEFTPEGLLGLDFERKINDRQSMFFNIDYLPSLSDMPNYRIDAKAGWQVLLDPESNMNLKIGINDRYDSDPGPDRKKNDLEYFATILWKF